MTNPTITVGEAVELINESILNFVDGLDTETISTLIYSINNEIQIRDYLLGLPATFPLETCKEFISYLGLSVDGAERYSLHTILSAYYYETEEMESSATHLAMALDIKSEYPLAKLLERVMNAGWPSSAFVQMREELHGKVVEHIQEISAQLI
jgi:hypothetical protein